MVVDFKAIKNVIDILDHRHINDVFAEYDFREPPTAENIAIFIADTIIKKLHTTPTKVAVCEGYKGEQQIHWVTWSS